MIGLGTLIGSVVIIICTFICEAIGIDRMFENFGEWLKNKTGNKLYITYWLNIDILCRDKFSMG